MKGEHAFELLSALDDDMIAAATLPEGGAVAGRKHREPRKRHENGFTRFLNSGWGAAVISGVVAIGVLLAIVQAGRQASGTAPGANAPGFNLQASSSVTEPEETTDGEPTDVFDTGSATRGPVDMVVEPAPVRVMAGGQTVLPQVYVTYLYTATSNSSAVRIDSTFEGVMERLDELADDLPVLTTANLTIDFTMEEAYSYLSVSIYDTEGMRCYSNKGTTSITPDLPAGTYYLVLNTRHTEDGLYGEGVEFICKLVITEIATLVLPDAPVTVTAGARTVYFTKGYLLSSDLEQETYSGAAGQLPALAADLQACAVTTDGHLSVTLRDDTLSLTRVAVYDADFRQVAEGETPEILTDLPDGSYYVILTVRELCTFNEYTSSALITYTEYPFMMVKTDGSALY